MKEKLERELNLSVSLSTISSSLREMNYSIKRVTLVPESRNTIKNIKVREIYCNQYL
jgi:hypothetical protein